MSRNIKQGKDVRPHSHREAEVRFGTRTENIAHRLNNKRYFEPIDNEIERWLESQPDDFIRRWSRLRK